MQNLRNDCTIVMFKDDIIMRMMIYCWGELGGNRMEADEGPERGGVVAM